MMEQQLFASSYIPTFGSISTRIADVCNNSGSAQDFNSEHGVLYAEIAALANDGTFRHISISNSSTSNNIQFYYRPNDNQITMLITSSSTQVAANTVTLSNVLDFNKIALKYKQNDFALWINGVQVATDTSGNTPIGLSELAFDNGNNSNNFYGKVREIQVFTEALTDAQLQKLTTI